MEQILNKLSEIETAAEAVVQETDRQKQVLSAEMEQQCKDFDEQLTKETDSKIAQIRRNLEHDKDAQLTALRRDTQEAFARLDAYYAANHQQISQEIYQKIISL